MSGGLHPAFARLARRVSAALLQFANEVDPVEFAAPAVVAPANGAEGTARGGLAARGSEPPKPAAGSAPPEPSSGAPKQSRVDRAAFEAAWPHLTGAQLAERFGVAVGSIRYFKKRFGLPDKPRGRARAARLSKAGAPAQVAPCVRAPSKPRASWAPPILDGGASCAKAPPAAPSKDAIPGLKPAVFDETAPVSLDAVIKFLRQRDMTVVVRPEGGFDLDGRRKVDTVELLRVANRKRALMGKPEFVLA